VFAFGPFRLDSGARRLLRDGEAVPLSPTQFDLLELLVAKAGQVISKDQLIDAVWRDVAVSDNSLEQAISALRRTLDPAAGRQFIETRPRRGYRFAVPVTRLEDRKSDEVLEALLAPHRAWIEGRAALETLEREQILHARAVFERVLPASPSQAPVHVGLANACAMQYEMTRADREPDSGALEMAAHHAREACRLDAQSAEAWATLGFVLDRTGPRTDALAAARRAVTLEPDNWRHFVRLSYVSWGEERLRAARRTLALLPGFPMAHWLAATVHVARQAIDEAERELEAGISVQGSQQPGARFGGVALHWLLGLTCMARGDDRRALAEFERELAGEAGGHLYARECCANTWYAIGALHLRRGRRDEARAGFSRALERIAAHPMARIGLAAADQPGDNGGLPPDARTGDRAAPGARAFDLALCRSAALVLGDRAPEASQLIVDALTVAPEGNAGWLLPIEPLLHVQSAPASWAVALLRLRSRAA
jgi:DNA-binding winged helix-turn-helix (wHTH) protein